MSNSVENRDLIDRKAASRLLKVSMRTLDRYRRNGQVATQIIDNKILLSKSELLDFIARHNQDRKGQNRQIKNARMSRDNNVDSGENREDIVSDGLHQEVQDDQGNTYTFVDTHEVPAKNQRDIHSHSHETADLIETYKKMYEELSLELRKRQEELEGAHYRIGQLEGQLRYSIPLPTHKSEILKLTESTQQLEQEITDKQVRLKKIREALYYEKLNKRIYMVVILGLLALQPLWIYLVSR